MPSIYEEQPQHFHKTITFVYSAHCIEHLKKVFYEMSKMFDSDLTLDDVCNYGVFCDVFIYANYRDIDDIEKMCDVPEQIKDDVTYNENERVMFVRDTMEKIIRGEMEKPKWMVYMEMYKSCNVYNDAPSTYLYLEPKEKRYDKFCTALIDFLYSPNMITKPSF